MRNISLAALLLASTPGLASESNAITAGQLLDACTRPSPHWIDFCNGFFQAAHDAAAIAGQVCTSDGTSRTRMVELFEAEAARLIASDASIAELPGISLAMTILARSFPCVP